MLEKVHGIKRFRIRARDGELGHIESLLFDDERWAVRYGVIDTGPWIFGRLVLVSPLHVKNIDYDRREVEVDLTKEQVKESPHISTHEPVSRAKERQFHQYYRIPVYWGGTGLWGKQMYPSYMPGVNYAEGLENQPLTGRPEENHLRSTEEVTGYSLEAEDGRVGEVADMLMERDSYAIRYLIVEPEREIGGEAFLISPEWVTGVSWIDATIHIPCRVETVTTAPGRGRTDPPIDRDLEEELFRHYRSTGYWEKEGSE
ncbi:PRC-barrel domain-containing protein [Salinispira pacifica]